MSTDARLTGQPPSVLEAAGFPESRASTGLSSDVRRRMDAYGIALPNRAPNGQQWPRYGNDLPADAGKDSEVQ